MDAPFGNYFRFPFGNQTSLDPFELALDRSEYEFSMEGPKEVTATLGFHRGDHTAAIMDLDGAAAFWGLKVEDASGHRTIVKSRVEWRTDTDPCEQYDLTRVDYDHRANLFKGELILGRAYRRKIDLAEPCTFTPSGVYQGQVIYASPFWTGKGRARWIGRFSGPRVKVTVK